MKFIKKKGKSLGIGLAMVGSLLVSSLQAGPVCFLEVKAGGGSRNKCSGSAERRL